MRSFKFITLLAFIFFITLDVFASSEQKEIAIGFAKFIEKLVKTTKGIGSGRICVIGSDKISDSFSKGKALTVTMESKRLIYCRAIYFAKSERKTFRPKAEKLAKKGILTISAFDDFIENKGMVKVEIGRRSFELEINQELLKQSNIKLNSLFTGLVVK